MSKATHATSGEVEGVEGATQSSEAVEVQVNALSEARLDAGRPVVLFDFDGTMVPGDTFGLFLSVLIRGTWWRYALGSVIFPLGTLLLMTYPTVGARLFLWVGTLGRTAASFNQALECFATRRFVQTPHLYVAALQALRQHQQQGDHIVVVSGCEVTLLRWVCERLGVPPECVIGSEIRRTALGYGVARHCIGAVKIAELTRRGFPSRVSHVYTDSVRDLPLIRIAARVTLVNVSPAVQRRVQAVTNAPIDVQHWRECVRLPDM